MALWCHPPALTPFGKLDGMETMAFHVVPDSVCRLTETIVGFLQVLFFFAVSTKRERPLTNEIALHVLEQASNMATKQASRILRGPPMDVRLARTQTNPCCLQKPELHCRSILSKRHLAEEVGMGKLVATNCGSASVLQIKQMGLLV
jgi:hypothetical protein